MIIYIKMDLALNNLQSLICHKTQPTNQPTLWNAPSAYFLKLRNNKNDTILLFTFSII